MHGVATKELEWIGSVSADENYMPAPGFSPDDSSMTDSLPDDMMSPEARRLIRNPDGSPVHSSGNSSASGTSSSEGDDPLHR